MKNESQKRWTNHLINEPIEPSSRSWTHDQRDETQTNKTDTTQERTEKGNRLRLENQSIEWTKHQKYKPRSLTMPGSCNDHQTNSPLTNDLGPFDSSELCVGRESALILTKTNEKTRPDLLWPGSDSGAPLFYHRHGGPALLWRLVDDSTATTTSITSRDSRLYESCAWEREEKSGECG